MLGKFATGGDLELPALLACADPLFSPLAFDMPICLVFRVRLPCQ